MIDRYKDTLANIIAMLLRETKDPSTRAVPIEALAHVYTADPEDDVQLETLLEYIGTTTEGGITISRKEGKSFIHVVDKVSLYLMLYSLNFNLASVDLLHWTDFERLVEHALGENGFITKKNFRFKDASNKRHEVDIVAVDKLSKEHIILVIDAKHWDYRSNSSATRVVEAGNEQYNRAVALGDALNVLTDLLFDLKVQWTNCIIVPMVVTLLNPPVQNFYIPIVSILAFNNFMMEFSDNMDMFKKKYVQGIPIQKRLR